MIRLSLFMTVLLFWQVTMAQNEDFYIPLPEGKPKPTDHRYQKVDKVTFDPGEELFYKLTFGWFTIGRANMKVDKKFHTINGRESFKIDVFGKTSGFVDWVAQVDDRWGAYVDRSSFVTHKSYRYIKEGNYRKNEITKFDHLTDMIEVTTMDKKTGEYKNAKYYQAMNNVRDMIGGFFYLRTFDFSGFKKGDMIEIDGFFEDTFYHMKIVYEGKEKLKTKLGTINTIKLRPIMPENSLFDGEDSITAWLSDDENKVPIKVSAEMFIGSAGFEITETRNLKYKLNVEE